MTIRQIISDNRGYLVALYLNGALYRQERDPNATSFVVEWQPVDLDSLDGRVVGVACRHDGILIVLLHDGRAFEEVPPIGGQFRRETAWKELSLPC